MNTNKKLGLMSGVSLGAGLMYIFDPQMGKRRRAVARDKALRLVRETEDALDTALRDLKNRGLGMIAATRSMIFEREAGDQVLADRVRSELGFLVGHPRSIDVAVENGAVTLSGPVLASEVDRLLRGVELVQGVKSVESRLDIHQTGESIPGLQGQPRDPAGRTIDLLQSHWSPATRFLVGAAAGVSLACAARRRDTLGVAAGICGAAMLVRALANMEFKRLAGVGVGARAVDIHKIINVAAPVDDVFAFWSNYENFPTFLANVREVKKTDEARSHWVMAGPAGAPIEWDAVVTSAVPNQILAWETLPGAPIQHAGSVRFQPNADGTTRLDIRMFYNPVAGGVGHAIASLFGVNPKGEIDDALMRMKSAIETRTKPRGAARKDEAESVRIH